MLVQERVQIVHDHIDRAVTHLPSLSFQERVGGVLWRRAFSSAPGCVAPTTAMSSAFSSPAITNTVIFLPEEPDSAARRHAGCGPARRRA